MPVLRTSDSLPAAEKLAELPDTPARAIVGAQATMIVSELRAVADDSPRWQTAISYKFWWFRRAVVGATEPE